MKRTPARTGTRHPRRIAVITGTRAEFGLFEPVLRAIAARPSLTPQLIVTGMHLLPRFGRTIRDIERGGWRVDATVRMQTGRDDVRGDAPAVARGIAGIGRALRRLRSDLAIVLGDRIEAFAGAGAAALSRIPLAHIHGGDRAPGQTDDLLRNAITRLAHVHLVASHEARRRLLKMGEAPWRIHRVGAPGLDEIVNHRSPARDHPSRTAAAATPLGLAVRPPGPRRRSITTISRRNTPCALVLYHPASPDPDRERRTMRDILWAIEHCRLHGVIIYPNSDPGHSGIIQAIRERSRTGQWTVFRSLPREAFLCLARGARLLTGNSSSGIIESASLGLNAVNIGPRQHGRLRCGPGVLDVPAQRTAILRGLRATLRRPRPRPGTSRYGDGRAGRRIARILQRLTIDQRLLRKELTC